MRLNKETKNLLIAMSFGDGYINPKGYLHLLHSQKQKDYLEYKYNLIKDLCKSGIKSTKVKGHKNTPYYYRVYLTTKINKFLKALRKSLYINNKKLISRSLLNRVDDRGLAIWWMDDGCRSPQYREGKVHSVNYIFSTYLSKEDNKIIADWLLDKYNIKVNITPRGKSGLYCITFHTKEGRKFSDIVRPYIIPSLLYKINPVGEVGNSLKQELP